MAFDENDPSDENWAQLKPLEPKIKGKGSPPGSSRKPTTSKNTGHVTKKIDMYYNSRELQRFLRDGSD